MRGDVQSCFRDAVSGVPLGRALRFDARAVIDFLTNLGRQLND
jgi:hypothetical protein